MIFELIKDTAKLAFIAASLYFALRIYVHRQLPAQFDFFEKHRAAVLFLLVLAVTAIKVSEDAVSGESGGGDAVGLRFIHTNMPPALSGIFEVITLSASGYVLFPLSLTITVALLIAGRRFEAWLLAASVTGGGIVVYVLKALVERTRPALWETEWYWGSSFPSGHTLVAAAFATAAVMVVARIWPAWRVAAIGVAVIWVFFVAMSRLVLGVHWPTDVLAAASIGALLSVAAGIVLKFRHIRST